MICSCKNGIRVEEELAQINHAFKQLAFLRRNIMVCWMTVKKIDDNEPFEKIDECVR